MFIKLAGELIGSSANGPGLRYVIFAQGCNHKCPGCFNQHTWDQSMGEAKLIDDVIKSIEKEADILDGVTFSGGDPLLQPEAFAIIADAIKTINKKLNIWCYTGYKFEDLLKFAKTDEGIKHLLSSIDVLVDGRFEQNNMYTDEDMQNIFKAKGELFRVFRGSKNQRIIDSKKSLKKKKVILVKEYDLSDILK